MLTTIMKMHLGDTIFLKRIFNLEGKIVSVKNTVESVPAHEFRQYVENHHVQARNKLLKKTLVEFQPHQHILWQGEVCVLLTRETQGWRPPVRFWWSASNKGPSAHFAS